MQAIRKLNQNNADILCHSEEHLTKVFCLHVHLIYFIRFIRQLSEFGHAVYQKRNLSAKFCRYLLVCHYRILYHIMQKPGNNRFLIQFQFRQDNSNAEGMNNIRFSRFTYLLFVRFVCNMICFFNQRNIGRRMIFTDAFDQFRIELLRFLKILRLSDITLHTVKFLLDLF